MKTAQQKVVRYFTRLGSNLDDLLPLFNNIFLLKVNQNVLRKRLSTRTSNKFGRTSEVQKWIFSWKKWREDHMREKGAIVVNANRTLQKIATDIVKKSKLSQ